MILEFDGTDYDDSNISSLVLDPNVYTPAKLKSKLTAKLKSLTAGQATDTDGDNNFALSAKTALDIKIYNKTTELTSSLDNISFCTLANIHSGAYSIKIIGDLSLTTQYGDPLNKDYTIATVETNNKQPSKTYALHMAGLCHLQPKNMIINSGTSSVSIPGGASSKWLSNRGFYANSGFPTTGFKGAVFSLMGSGLETNYRCKSTDNGGKITLSTTSGTGGLSGTGTNCTVTYNSETKANFTAGGTPTITMEYTSDNGSTWVQVGSYTIPEPTKWALGGGVHTYGNNNNLSTSTTFAALDACRKVGPNADNGTTTLAQAINMTAAGKAWRQKYLYRRNEITNSPTVSQPENGGGEGGGLYSRDVDGTFTGEWGAVSAYGSVWTGGESFSGGPEWWTAEAWSTSGQYAVHELGGTDGLSPNLRYPAVCRGE